MTRTCMIILLTNYVEKHTRIKKTKNVICKVISSIVCATYVVVFISWCYRGSVVSSVFFTKNQQYLYHVLIVITKQKLHFSFYSNWRFTHPLPHIFINSFENDLMLSGSKRIYVCTIYECHRFYLMCLIVKITQKWFFSSNSSLCKRVDFYCPDFNEEQACQIKVYLLRVEISKELGKLF